MKRNRFTKAIILLGVIVFSLSFLATSCKEEHDKPDPTPNPTPQNKLYGKWVTDHWQAFNDTIFFDSDYYVKNYFEGGSPGYSVSNDTIYFHFAIIDYPCRFILSNDSLTIFEFGDILSRFPVQREDIIFTKIK